MYCPIICKFFNTINTASYLLYNFLFSTEQIELEVYAKNTVAEMLSTGLVLIKSICFSLLLH